MNKVNYRHFHPKTQGCSIKHAGGASNPSAHREEANARRATPPLAADAGPEWPPAPPG